MNRLRIKNNPPKGLFFLYNTVIGRIILKPIVKSKKIEQVIGKIMDSKLSKPFIKHFIKKNNINMDDYISCDYKSFNDFFVRNIKSEKRVIDKDKNSLIAPCDSKLQHYKISKDSTFKIKGLNYNLESILRNKKLSQEYKDGDLLIFRLSPEDYHHYFYIDYGIIEKKYDIQGIFHSVNPVVYDNYKVFAENTRSYTIINTENFGKILYIEVGALLVSKINNHNNHKKVKKGEEKGYFEYGGSTVVIIFKENVIKLDEDIIRNSNDGYETIVKFGEKIGEKR